MLEKKDKCVDIFIRVFIGMRPLATAGGTVIAVYGYGSAWPQLTHNIFCKKSLPHRSSHCDFTHLFFSRGQWLRRFSVNFSLGLVGVWRAPPHPSWVQPPWRPDPHVHWPPR